MSRRLLAALLVVPSLLLAGCTEQGEQADTTSPVTEWNPPQPVVAFSGPTVAGTDFRSSAYRGRVLVVNFWYKDCPPCNTEAPILKSLAAEFAADDVQFVGINTEDNAANAQSFESSYGIAYPSVLDQSNRGAAQLAFQGQVGPAAIPSTLVLDRRGRPVSRILGAVDASTLHTLIQDAVDGKAA